MDLQLQRYVDEAFLRYDRDRNGYLTLNELVPFFNELMPQIGHTNRRFGHYNDIFSIAGNMDKNGDGRIGKLELYVALQQIKNSQYNPNQFGNQGHHGHGGGCCGGR